MTAQPLFEPAAHRPLVGSPWSEDGARAAIAEIAGDAIAAYRGPDRLWPNHPDEEFDADEAARSYRSVYFGAAGMAWALDELARDGLAPALPWLAELAAALPGDFLTAPELTELETGTPPPPPSLLFGEVGILLAVEAITRDWDDSARPGRRERLAARIAANARNPAREPCWGSPGTMIAALALHRITGEPRWRDAYRDSATWLLDQWEEQLWVQDLYGGQHRFVGAGHGFAGNAFALLAGADLLDQATATALVTRVARTTVDLAIADVEEPGLVQWPPVVGQPFERQPLQWCHGSPGIVISLRQLPSAGLDPRTARTLTAGAELTWRAGPLVKGAGLCHGTAGNAFALLAEHGRTGDPRWLQRARAFAMDAVADVAARRHTHDQGRYTLFTGDIGVALLLRACLRGGDPAFPFLERPLG